MALAEPPESKMEMEGLRLVWDEPASEQEQAQAGAAAESEAGSKAFA